MNEIWKDIKNFEGYYQVSNLGRIKSLERIVKSRGNGTMVIKERILRPSLNGSGYPIVGLSKESESTSYIVHRLVAEAFIPNPDNLSDVNHINQDKTDNRVDNLNWMSHKDNLNYGSRNEKIAAKNSKAVYCEELDLTFKNAVEAANFIGLYDSANLSQHLNGKKKTCGKNPNNKKQRLHWKYV